MSFRQLVYEVQTRCWLAEYSPPNALITLDKVPDAAIKAIKATGATYLWLMGVWQTGLAGRDEARRHPDLQASYHAALADFTIEDVVGSPYAIKEYVVASDFGGNDALLHLRRRLAQNGLKLILDFVPNHLALDNLWAYTNPEYFIAGNAEDVERGLGKEISTRAGNKVLLHGRDPYFPPWTDTLQLDWSSPKLLAALEELLLHLATLCDGLRCDMAMLLLKEVFVKTWGRVIASEEEPWQRLISRVKSEHPSFLFLAEAYWDMEWQLTCQGFDYVYDKRLYDRLAHGDAAAVRSHLLMAPDFHDKQIRFLENHDEPRAAVTFSTERHKAALVLLSALPGMWLLHHHEDDGAQIKLPVQLARYPHEEVNKDLYDFYRKIFGLTAQIPANSQWVLLTTHPAWEGNFSADQFVAYALMSAGQVKNIIIVNFAPWPGECYLALEKLGLRGNKYKLIDRLGNVEYIRDGEELRQKGLFVALPPFGAHYFAVVYGD